MNSEHAGQCERWSGAPFPGWRSNALSIQHLEWQRARHAARDGNDLALSFALPVVTFVISASYSAGLSVLD